ncbi:RagB/SusD family nutrient uptake outer membrane protein [Chitinophaga sp. LS1]|uniref:RagB/SusD family nutrient uptake outer membrane protein n=1 Tax=Chitinophaga sp. LS1 TaxID=3051176 RepID=UPI002AAC154B|nr:RagB/SusD family nutrient uptake outer membrane protein [Chitinophaga sp. LS1]WPV67820.1 RagB/SusD family nutrient uptake outer membrane protein [Chitinophaga sp. LS1]
MNKTHNSSNNFPLLDKDRNIIFALLFFCSMLQTGCSRLISIDPPNNSLNGTNVYSIDETAIAAVTNIYSTISKDNHNAFSGSGGLTSISLYAGLSADELTLFNTSNVFLNNFYANSLTADYDILLWNYDYGIIFNANSAIEGLTNKNTLTSEVQNQLLGEAKLIRAFCYFYLVNLYGEVPLVLSTNPIINSTLSKSSVDLIYSQIIDDLISAENLLSENFLSGNLIGGTSERVRPTKWAAAALLARVYLYNSDFTNSEKQASIVIGNQSLFKLDSLDFTFLKNSNESIWQLQVVDNTSANTGDGKVFVLPDSGPNTDNYPVVLSRHIYDNFEIGDLRRKKWIDSVVTDNGTYFFPYKYKSGALASDNNPTEYIMILRLAEQYLIRAEARIQQGKLQEGVADINVIRHRAGLEDIPLTTKDSLNIAVLQERRVELFSEWGHRWLDLKRTKLIDNVMKDISVEKGGTWNTNWQLYPIANTELNANSNLTQNEGY